MNTVSGLPPKHLSLLREIFSRFPEVGEVVLYGSRAKEKSLMIIPLL